MKGLKANHFALSAFASVLILLAPGGLSRARASSNPIPPSVAQMVQFEQWFLYYSPAGGAPTKGPPAPQPAAPPCYIGQSLRDCILPGIAVPPPAPAPAPAPKPAMLPSYLSVSLAPGMEQFLQQAIVRLQPYLTPTQKTAIQGLPLTSTNCSTATPVLLVTQANSAAGKIRLCIAPILVRAVFGGSAKIFVSFNDRLQSFGISPYSFDGTYKQYHGGQMAEADFNAVISSYGKMIFQQFAIAMDFVIAREMAKIYLRTSSTPVVTAPAANIEARLVVTKADVGVDLSSLITALEPATSKYDPSTWGYNTAGDSAAILVEFANTANGQ